MAAGRHCLLDGRRRQLKPVRNQLIFRRDAPPSIDQSGGGRLRYPPAQTVRPNGPISSVASTVTEPVQVVLVEAEMVPELVEHGHPDFSDEVGLVH